MMPLLKWRQQNLDRPNSTPTTHLRRIYRGRNANDLVIFFQDGKIPPIWQRSTKSAMQKIWNTRMAIARMARMAIAPTLAFICTRMSVMSIRLLSWAMLSIFLEHQIQMFPRCWCMHQNGFHIIGFKTFSTGQAGQASSILTSSI